MLEHCRKWPAYLALAVLVLLQGCGQKSDEGFHTYNDSAPASPPEGGSGVLVLPTESTPPQASESDSPPVATTPEVAAANPESPAPSASEKPATGDAAATVNPSDVIAPAATPASPPASAVPVEHELALALPPPPPEAVSMESSATAAGTPMPAREIKLLIPEKEFKVEGPDGALRVSFDDIDLLKVLNADPVPVDIEKHLPHWLSGLNGKMVRIRGWMYPPNQETDIPAFLFVRDNQICCFGRKAMIYDKFGVKLREGVTTNYIQGRPFDVIGQMVVKSFLLDGELFFLYKINDAVIVDK